MRKNILRRTWNQLLQGIAFWYILPPRLKVFLHQLRGVHFKDPGRTYIYDHVLLDSVAPDRIHIGKNVRITSGCKIYAHEFAIARPKNKISYFDVHIEDDAFIGVNSLIVKSITVGEGAIVGAGSVVNKDVPPNTLVAGSPAKVIKRLLPVDKR